MCGAEFPGLGLLLTCNSECALEISFRFRCIRFVRLERDFTSDTIHLGLKPSFLGCINSADRFANATPSVIELTKLGMRNRQI